MSLLIEIFSNTRERWAESKNQVPADREVSAAVQERIKDALRRIEKSKNQKTAPEDFISLSDAKARVHLPS